MHTIKDIRVGTVFRLKVTGNERERAVKVNRLDACKHSRGTKVHVNGDGCYETIAPIVIIATGQETD